MAISVDGIVSGIDTTSLISELSEAYSAPKDLLEEDITDAENLQSAMTTLSGLLGDVSDALEEIEDIEDFRTFSASYEENDDLVVEASGEAIAGVYSVEIDSLATSELEASNAFADHTSSGVIAEGTLSVTYAGTTTEFTVDSSNSSNFGPTAFKIGTSMSGDNVLKFNSSMAWTETSGQKCPTR